MRRNVKSHRTVCHSSDPPASTLKVELHPKKMLFCVWCRYTALHANVVAKWLGVINRPHAILHHDSARPHAAVITRQKFMAFGWNVLPHTPSSPDLVATDYPLFWVLNNSFSQKHFDVFDAVKTTIQKFLTRDHQNFTAVRFISYERDGKKI
ncbi:transposase [Trichonephila clavipes]|nr:transposase [Trichonephila clavipes]